MRTNVGGAALGSGARHWITFTVDVSHIRWLVTHTLHTLPIGSRIISLRDTLQIRW